MQLKEVLSMNGGDGETSYANNSSFQRNILEAARAAVGEAAVDLYGCGVSFPEKLSVADLGCSSGPNSLSAVTAVVDAIEEKSWQLGRPPPEFQLFLNDLPGNDFNSVFRSLQAFYEQRGASAGGRERSRCFVAGVPGTFYGRLFQSRSIHFFCSSTALHWLSQVPPKLQAKHEPLNKRSVHISTESPPLVVDAYRTQFQKDFSDFLKCRSEEMVVSGRMVLILPGRRTSDTTTELELTSVLTPLTQVLMNMVQEGYTTKEKVESFNLPCYVPCAMEVEHEIQREGSFSLKNLEIFDVEYWGASQDRDGNIEHNGILPNKLARDQANCLRAALEPILASHFGGEIIDDLFLRYGKALEDHFSRNKSIKMTNLVVSLVRKP